MNWAGLGLVLLKEGKKEEADGVIEKAKRLSPEAYEGIKESYNEYQNEIREAQAKAPEGMIYIPAGWFWMGCSPNDNAGTTNEKPYHKVYLDGYYIDKYPVTNEQYKKFCDATGYKYPSHWKIRVKKQVQKIGIFGNKTIEVDEDVSGLPDELKNHPVVYVTWEDANSYCKWAGKELPTEAQWEKAARGTDGRIYPWGNEWDASKACFNTGNGTCAVGSYPAGASPYGVLDMAGNVWEWCRDWYGRNYYANSPDHNPSGPDSGKVRVLRGGSWLSNDSGDLRVSVRLNDEPSYGIGVVGFRCIRQVSK